MENLHIQNGPIDQDQDHIVNNPEDSIGAHNIYNINKNFVFEIGMKFGSEEESYNAYNSYAVAKGFGIRRGKKTYNRNNEMTRCLFLCSCEGKYGKLSPFEERKRERLEYRCGCMARIRFKISIGTWEVCEFNDVHSHPMIEDNLRHFIQSGRKLTSATKNILSSMVDAGVRTKKAVRYLQNEAGGIENAGFTEQDAHNFIQAHKRNKISSGDAQTLINHFMDLQSEDSNFFYSFQVDEDGRLCSFFWRDSISRLHYECFGDVIIFDTTYRTNKYDMICAPFVGVNNHWKNIFFGCAFLCNETIGSFIWLFQIFLKAMGGRAPKTIFTDQAPAIAFAIKEVFPDACHRLCEWHIDRNAQKNIPHLYWKAGFKAYFDKLLWRCKTEAEFDLVWKKMISEWDCGSNTWLQKLYDLKEKWCPAFSRSIFSADIKSTQRSESTNRVFTEMACKTMSITEFVKQYEQRTIEMRDIEAAEDYKCRGKPKFSIKDCGILKHAASVYTRRIYTSFQHEFLQAFTKKVINVETNETCSKYTILMGESGQTEIVQFNSIDNSIMCTCHMFESMGWLCCHALRVLSFDLNFSSIPEKYILKRWSKSAKQGNGFEEYINKKETSKSSMSTRLNGLMKESFAVMTLATNDADSEEIARKYLYQAKVEITNLQSELYVEGRDRDMHKISSNAEPFQGSKDQILDPIKKKGKGKGYGRLKPNIEKRRRTSRVKVRLPHEQQFLSTMAATTGTQSYLTSQMGLSFQPHGDSINTFTQLLSQDPNLHTSGSNQNQGLNNNQANAHI